MASTATVPARRNLACAIVVLAIAAGALAGCGGGGSKSSSRVQKITSCIDATKARAASAGSSLKTALGAIQVANPSGVAQVFKSPAAARAYAQEKEPYLQKIQIKDVVVQSDNSELLSLFRGCVK
jgi:hypothetical protein